MQPWTKKPPPNFVPKQAKAGIGERPRGGKRTLWKRHEPPNDQKRGWERGKQKTGGVTRYIQQSNSTQQRKRNKAAKKNSTKSSKSGKEGLPKVVGKNLKPSLAKGKPRLGQRVKKRLDLIQKALGKDTSQKKKRGGDNRGGARL